MSSISNISVGGKYAGIQAHKARHEMNASIMRLSSGNRTLMGGDAAGGSISNNLKARAMSTYVAARNAEDGIGALLTAESAVNEIAKIAYRLRELGIQADNANLHVSTMEVAAMNKEATLLYQTIVDIVAETTFNENALLGATSQTHSIGVSVDGDSGSELLTITTNDSFTATPGTYTAAVAADITADLLLVDVALSLGHIAAGINSLKARQNVAYGMAANLEAAAARISDTDFASETANLTKFSILNQSAMAMVAQANQAQSAILAVLQ